MSRQIQIGENLIWSGGNGPAYRVRNVDGSKSKPATYRQFIAPEQDYSGVERMQPRMSRKGNRISGTLPRLAGRW